ncbi:GGDEF domain-containing protein [Flavisphingomonas formosensis]|uniref:GGDEF domain-containing protein n=1 Tax=Flavisphingomonas formosensis TaxID=861534 RepID=UPI0012FB5FB6|nr:GGDEF domain-containing protein [Sphingomonas formosensis]
MKPTLYLAVALFLISAMSSVMLMVAWRRFGKPPHAVTWSIGFACATMMFAIRIGVRPEEGHPLLWLSANGLGMLSAVFLTVGHRQRVGAPLLLVPLFAGWIAAMVVLGYATLISPHVGMQRGVGPGYAAIVIALGVHGLLQVDRRLTAVELAGVYVLGLFGAIEAASFVFGLAQGQAGDPALMEVYSNTRALALPALHACVGIFLAFLVADDLATQMRQLASTDPLTGIANRRGFEIAAAGEFARAVRRRQPLAVVIADIDRFKAINDVHGHDGGDRALQAFADHCRQALRGQDVLGRLGGEEFAIVLPDTGCGEAMAKIEALRLSLSACRCPAVAGKAMTASFGVAMRENEDESIGDILRRADQALYFSKRRGRNRSTLYGEETPKRIVRAA